ncbi:ECF transporter S component [Clostridium sp.]|uniref:ECF transporter S component n=1 Tax=Clostridium sp. TaxID=1506 RepID=UPI002633D961|nr:ECF transporter S component [Clostridium sp.]
MNNNQNKNLSKFIKISLLGAMSVVLMYFDFPIPFLPFPWLKIDLSDVPSLMGALAYGPLTGIVIELLKNLLILLVKGTQTGLIGEIANFIVGISLVVPAAYLYNKNRNKKNLIIGMILGLISMEVIGIITNIYFLLPAFNMPMSGTEAIKYITIGLIPFNGIKAIMVNGISYYLFKRLAKLIFNIDSKLH